MIVFIVSGMVCHFHVASSHTRRKENNHVHNKKIKYYVLFDIVPLRTTLGLFLVSSLPFKYLHVALCIIKVKSVK